ncbi:hypothetical protein CCHL11_00971 [Colletotrichum chlorophyti]|uniref:DJ-1/PfpI domain-containing protein n=1 Tax=Colletotrichum chlorophyti TaxID=708187 RepID=A0A1Q8S7X1_9PEZI|nr:hypothetical protein CCHL11_00971 [Colletotrichum chlorophyti]
MTLSIITHRSKPVSTHIPSHTPGFRSDIFEAQVIATNDFNFAPPLDILLVPGGLGNRFLERNKDKAIED